MVATEATVLTSGAAVEVCRETKSLISWASDLEENYDKLIDQEDKLYSRRDALEYEVRRDGSHGTTQVNKERKTWLGRVKKAEKKVLELKKEYGTVKKSIWGKCNVWRRADLSKRIAEKCKVLHDLWSEGKFDKVVVEEEPRPVRPPDVHKTEDKPSLHRYVEEILAYLGDKEVRRVGIWGLPGTGKTTIMKNLKDHENTAKMFDIVIWINVTKNLSITNMQDAILQQLKLDMEGTTDIVLRISQKLEGKRCLFLLDGVCKEIDLRQVGVCSNHEGWKLVLTTRDRKICCDMNAEQIKVRPLSDADAWKLFRAEVGPTINLPGVRPIAERVAKYCAGYPLLLDKVAKTFRRMENVDLWLEGCSNLQRWPSFKIEGTDEMVEFLEFCYEQLGSEETKVCFLYGALYSEDCDIYIDHLLECWRAEDFIYDSQDFRVAHRKGQTILNDLIDVSFLEKSEKMKHVRINKVIRKMALQISLRTEGCRFFARVSEGLEEPPGKKEWKEANRISLMDNKLCTLPPELNCKDLLTLFLQGNSELKVIPEKFFVSMKNLLVLDLHGTGITSLPSSLSGLTRLRVLYLRSCVLLMELPSNIDAIKCLQVLDIRGTGINSLPIKIGSLNGLRCLRMALSNFGKGCVTRGKSERVEFDQHVINLLSLPSLEELSIDVDPYTQWWNTAIQAITKKVTTSTSLSFFFPQVDCLEIRIKRRPLQKEWQFNGGGHHDPIRHLKFENGKGVDLAVSNLLAKSDVFELVGHKGALRLSDFDIKYMNEIRVCSIEGCSEIKTIIDCNNGVTRGAVLKCLEEMHINNAPKLESIWEGPVPVGSLAGLTTLIFCHCSKLKKIFSNGMIQQLSNLQHLRVEECLELVEIIMESENNGLVPVALPFLKTLKLLDLPNLKRIWRDDSLLWPSLERIKIFDCQGLTSFPFNNGNANRMMIEVQQSWWNALAWEDKAIKKRLESFCIFQ